MQLESMYQEIILDHYRNPHHRGLREPFDAEVHHVNPVCGDEITLRVLLKTLPSAGNAAGDAVVVGEGGFAGVGLGDFGAQKVFVEFKADKMSFDGKLAL